jgi:hypothetical protein
VDGGRTRHLEPGTGRLRRLQRGRDPGRSSLIRHRRCLVEGDRAVGRTTIDATNIYGDRDADFSSLAHQVKSILGGPTAKSFNTNWAVLYDQIAGQRVRPSNMFACDPEAREVTEGLISDAGF